MASACQLRVFGECASNSPGGLKTSGVRGDRTQEDILLHRLQRNPYTVFLEWTPQTRGSADALGEGRNTLCWRPPGLLLLCAGPSEIQHP